MKSTSCIIMFAPCALIILLGCLEYATFAAPAQSTNFVNITGCPRIVGRKEWKARRPVRFNTLPVTPTPYVVIHHGGIRKYCRDQDTCSAIVRSYQNFHMDDRDWWDIGYNFLIGEDGNAYEGRGWDRIGAHAPGYNTQSIGICLLGHFSDFLPNAAALKTLNELIACGVSLGKISDEYNVIGHRQTRSTECPGEVFYKYVMNLPGWTSNPIPRRPITMTTEATTSGNNTIEGNSKSNINL